MSKAKKFATAHALIKAAPAPEWRQRGRVDRSAMFPVPPPTSDAPLDYATWLTALKARIHQERLRVVLASHAAMMRLALQIETQAHRRSAGELRVPLGHALAQLLQNLQQFKGVGVLSLRTPTVLPSVRAAGVTRFAPPFQPWICTLYIDRERDAQGIPGANMSLSSVRPLRWSRTSRRPPWKSKGRSTSRKKRFGATRRNPWKPL